MVEIFRTNVTCKVDSVKVIDVLNRHLPGHKFNFDLDDPDCVLRAEGNNCLVLTGKIVELVQAQDVEISLIVD